MESTARPEGALNFASLPAPSAHAPAAAPQAPASALTAPTGVTTRMQ